MRRTFLKAIPAAMCASIVAPSLLTSRMANANEAAWPTKPIRLMVPAAPGAGPDSTARIIAHTVSERLGQPIIVENKPGGSGTVAASLGMLAPADGYTFIYCIPSTQIMPPKSVRYDPVNDLIPVSLAVTASFILVVNPTLPYKSVRELIDAARANPGKINFGSSGTGTFGHLLGASFGLSTDIDLMHVPFTSEPPVTNAIIGGEIQMAFISSGVSLPLIQSGKLRALGVSSGKRMPGMPDNIPLIAETVPGYDMVTYNYLAAKAGTPRHIVEKMNKAINTTMSDPAVRERFTSRGLNPGGGSPEDMGKIIAAQRVKLSELLQRANIVLS
ncbi:Bug family tripartite tricarboxylate transporter substrate binding protein [Ottowia thiooxydans]|uniref:Bug family tripartite tricarboxylate transporter substrate binding protein n=1 Tax=Ottowia thiooxydans TaxID=219182 RepID=UPI0004138CED|nr:tripartite tricarboxylate transporter substrate binding protein [Ottowia thiooxydans]